MEVLMWWHGYLYVWLLLTIWCKANTRDRDSSPSHTGSPMHNGTPRIYSDSLSWRFVSVWLLTVKNIKKLWMGCYRYSLVWALILPGIKTEGPARNITFLGISIDMVSMALSLPQQNVEDLLLLLNSYMSMTRDSSRQLQQLAGKRAWASNCVHRGRIYTQRVLTALRPLREQNHKATLSKELVADLLAFFQCQSLIPPKLLACWYIYWLVLHWYWNGVIHWLGLHGLGNWCAQVTWQTYWH